MPLRIWDCGISFAGEDKLIARSIVDRLRGRYGLDVFIDKDFPEWVFASDLQRRLKRIFGEQLRHCIVLISERYRKQFTLIELDAFLTRYYKEQARDPDFPFLIPVKLDKTVLSGFPESLAFAALESHSVEDVCEWIYWLIGFTEATQQSIVELLEKADYKAVITIGEAALSADRDQRHILSDRQKGFVYYNLASAYCLFSQSSDDSGAKQEYLDIALKLLRAWIATPSLRPNHQLCEQVLHLIRHDNDLLALKRDQLRRREIQRSLNSICHPKRTTLNGKESLRGGGCIATGMNVYTPKGETPVETLRTGDLVYAMEISGRLIETEIASIHPSLAWTTITFNDTIVVSEAQRLFCS